MKQKYNNTLVIFDEIVEALKSIVECSMVRDENEYFNNKYESETNNIISEDEEILYNALKELKKTIDASARLFRTFIEDELSKISCDKFKLSCNYLLGYEKRKLTAEKKSIELLKNASIGIESLYEVSEDEKIRAQKENRRQEELIRQQNERERKVKEKEEKENKKEKELEEQGKQQHLLRQKAEAELEKQNNQRKEKLEQMYQKDGSLL